MSYEVFARKYRPQTFDDIVGQNHVTRTLKNAVEQNRLAHAYLFVGPRGTGKTSTARILAKALNCIHGPTVTPCGKCDNCREIAGGNSLDVIELDAASNRGIDDVRELRDNVRYAPAKGRFKIYIIDEVHMLTKEAANALLKTLEEPPKHVIFCLATTEPEKVADHDFIPMPAVRSAPHRNESDCATAAIDRDEGETDAGGGGGACHCARCGRRNARCGIDARSTGGILRRKIAEADVLNVFGFTSQQMVADFVGRILRGETADALALLHEQCEAGKDMMKLMSDTIAYLRDLLVFKVKPDALSDEASAETRATFAEQAPLLETDRVLELIDQFAAAEGRMKWAPNKSCISKSRSSERSKRSTRRRSIEVIENLNALRDGNPVAPPAKRSGKDVVTAVADRGAATAGYKANESAADVNEIWSKVVAQIKTRRPFIKSWIEEAHPLVRAGGISSWVFPTSNEW